MSDPFVIKAQIALFSNTGNDNDCLIYDASGKINAQLSVDKRTAKKIGERSFWWVTTDDAGMINLSHKAKEEEFELYTFEVMNGGE